MIGHSKPGDFLCHYTTIDKAIQIIESGQIWLSPMKGVNDPKEFSNWKLNCRFSDREPKFKEWQEISSAISDKCKTIAKLSCFSMDTVSEHDSGFQRYVDMGCIGRGFANSPMWHFYGDGHNGCCLMFKKDMIISELMKQARDLQYISGNVEYIDELLARDIANDAYCFDLAKFDLLGVNKYSFEFLTERVRDIYFKKQRVWSYENEFRIMVLSENDKPFKLRFNNSLVNIFFGVNSSQENQKKIKDKVKGMSVGCSELFFKNQSIQVKV
ncbi:DUF2971 domain-containing protein [Colwellia sp. E2M01]|uniref:DUF2971 domain-containing protein n=1 Tax=Colwellia sp. E2M01 TaxID=2841561 RepID=UPI001C0943E4|nr:DUF2971 domain-containing protein [Colwellia sp. E2M01]MBU2871510.1 DUF2971 domain-containing protein [Colwellia sp. E2M01]